MQKLYMGALLYCFSITAMNEATRAKYERFIINVQQECQFLEDAIKKGSNSRHFVRTLVHRRNFVNRKMALNAGKLENNPNNKKSFEIYDMLRTAQVYIDNVLS